MSAVLPSWISPRGELKTQYLGKIIMKRLTIIAILLVFCCGLLIGHLLTNNIRIPVKIDKFLNETTANRSIVNKRTVRNLSEKYKVINISEYDSKALSSMRFDFTGIDPAKLIEEATIGESCARTDALIYAYFKEWATFDHLEAMSFARTQPNAAMCMVAILEGWASVDPKLAFDWVITNPTESMSSSLDLVMGKMASIDPAYFISIINRVPYEVIQNNLAILVDQFIVDGKKEELFGWVNSLDNNDPIKSDAYVAIMNSWGAKNMDEVIAVFSKIESDQVRVSAMSGFVNASIYTNPKEIYSWIESNLSNDPKQKELLTLVVDKWPETDLNGYVSWISAFDQGKLTDRMVTSLISRTRDSDILFTSEWLGKIKNLGVRQQMVSDFVNQMDVSRLNIVKNSLNSEVSAKAQSRLKTLSTK